MFNSLPVFLREGAEALIGCMVLSQSRQLLRRVVLGALLGLGASLAVGIAIHIGAQEAEAAWAPVEGIVTVGAAFFLLGLGGYHLLRHHHLPKQAGLLGAFLLVLREGVEFTLFSLDQSLETVLVAVIVGGGILGILNSAPRHSILDRCWDVGQ